MGIFNLGTRALGLMKSGALSRGRGQLQAYKNDLMKLGAKPWDVKYITQAMPEGPTTLSEFRGRVTLPPTVRTMNVGDYTGDVQYPDYQRVFGDDLLENMLGGTAYDETLFYLEHPGQANRLFRSDNDHLFKHYLKSADDYVEPVGFTLKVPKSPSPEQASSLRDFRDLLDEYNLAEVRSPVDFGHFSDYMRYAPGYIMGHMRRVDMPKSVGNWRMIEEMQSDLNPYSIDRNLRQQHDIVLDDPLREMLYVPEEIQKGKEQMLTSMVLADALQSGKRGIAVPPLEYLAYLRSHQPTEIPPKFRALYGADLDKRLKEMERIGIGKSDVVDFRDIPKFMTEGKEYSGRDWVNIFNAPPYELRNEPFRVFRFGDPGSIDLSEIPMFNEGGLV